MKKIIFLTLFAIGFSAFRCIAQSEGNPVIFTNSQDIDRSRYEDIKESPYLFKYWVLASIISPNIDVYTDVLVNYNGYTKSFEVAKDKKFIDLDERWYLRVEIDPEQNPGLEKEFGKEKLVFQRGLHPKIENIFAQVIHPGTRITLIKTFDVDLSKKRVENVGKAVEFKRFVGKFTYFMIKDGEFHPVSTRKKSFLKALGNHSEIEEYIKQENINFDSEDDLRKLILFVEKKRF